MKMSMYDQLVYVYSVAQLVDGMHLIHDNIHPMYDVIWILDAPLP